MSVTAGRLAAAFCVPAFVYWAAWVSPTLPFESGSRVFGGLAFLLPVVSLVAIVALVVAVADAVQTRRHAQAVRLVGLAVAAIAGTAAGMWLGPVHKMQRVRHAAVAAMPLVRAIEAFERQERRPPRDLSELVPRYLEGIPSTGMRGYSEWDYIHGADAHTYSENTWVLRVHTGGPGINFDQLLYFPNQQYPELGPGGWIERIGAWGYVHE